MELYIDMDNCTKLHMDNCTRTAVHGQSYMGSNTQTAVQRKLSTHDTRIMAVLNTQLAMAVLNTQLRMDNCIEELCIDGRIANGTRTAVK